MSELTESERAEFFKNLEAEAGFQWKWTKLNRSFNQMTELATFLANLAVVVLSSVSSGLAQAKASLPVELSVWIAGLAAFGASTRVLAANLLFKERQVVHEVRARKITIVQERLRFGLICLRKAVEEYHEVIAVSEEESVQEHAARRQAKKGSTGKTRGRGESARESKG